MNSYKSTLNKNKNNSQKSNFNNDKDYSYTLIKLLGIIFILAFSFTIYRQQLEINTLNSIYKDAIYEYEERQKSLKSLENELKNVDTDAFIEKQAREKLKMVKPNEKVYVDTNKKNNINE